MKLNSYLPAGLLDEALSPAAAEARRAFSVLESVVQGACADAASQAQHSLLQSFTRAENDDGSFGSLRQFCKALCPSWYHSLIDELDAVSLEIFLKHFLVAHETWGHAESSTALVRSLLECCVQRSVPVQAQPLKGEEREIPEQWQSKLRVKDSLLGRSFVIGKRFLCRPQFFELIIGPITPQMLSVFQKRGWAQDLDGSTRLQRTLSFTVPFYMKRKVKFVVETSDFILARAILGTSKIHTVEQL